MDTIKGADKTLYVLEYIMGHYDHEFSVSGLSRELGYGKTVTYRIIQTLLKRGYLVKNERHGTYAPGLKLVELGAKVQEKFKIHKIVRPHLEKLHRLTNETVNLGILVGTEVTYLDKIESSNFLRTDLRVGTSVPVFCTGLGKAILSVHPQKEEILARLDMKKYTENTISSAENLKAELVQIKERGYALDYEEYIPGVICLAVPVKTSVKIMPAAISAAGPTTRFTPEYIEKLVKLIMEVGNDLEENIHLTTS